MAKTLDLSQFAAKLGRSRERVCQLVAEGRIKPAPEMIPLGKRGHIYRFQATAKKVGKDGKPGRPKKSLDKAKVKPHH